ncbi:MAG: SDR family NAD(P)-dependent oxidoreductase [Acidimicrobiales bacterium]
MGKQRDAQGGHGQPISFKDQVVVVTGGARGLGRNYAIELARLGASVVVNGISRDVDGRSFAEKTVDVIRAAGGVAIADHHPVDDAEAAPLIIETAIEEFGQIDALINNAGLTHFSSFEQTDLDLFLRMIRLHLVASFLISQTAFGYMAKQGYGRILLTGSATGMFGRKQGVAYASAKAGLIGLLNVISIEGAEKGILANLINPVAKTDIADRAIVRGEATVRTTHAAEEPPRGTTEFVTPLAIYLVSNQCNSTHNIFSAAYGKYARQAIGQGSGWTSPDDAIPPRVEDIAEHWNDVLSRDEVVYPLSTWEQVETSKPTD